jgi:hypothetical protein
MYYRLLTIFRGGYFRFSLAVFATATKQRPVKIKIFASGYQLLVKIDFRWRLCYTSRL